MDLKEQLKKVGHWTKRNNPTILSILTLVLIIVTIISIIAVSYSSNVALYLATERQKEDRLNNLALSHNLILELEWNKIGINNAFQSIKSIENTTESRKDTFEILALTKARDKTTFGNQVIRKQLELYNTYFTEIKQSLEQIRIAELQGNRRLKKEHIDNVFRLSRKVINGDLDMINIDTFLEIMREYHQQQADKYNSLDKEMRKKLSKFYD